MNPKILEIPQRSEEWEQARLGKATASRFKDVLDKIKSGESAKRRNYKAELVVERLTGATPERYSNRFMDWGTETEDLAKLMYTLRTGNVVTDVGFFVHAELEAGASPDGLVGTDGLLEIKCRQIANHIQMLRNGEVSTEYIPQLMGQLWLTNRKWVDFVSFAPELPENAQLFIKRVFRDGEYISTLDEEVRSFLTEVAVDVEFVKGYKNG